MQNEALVDYVLPIVSLMSCLPQCTWQRVLTASFDCRFLAMASGSEQSTVESSKEARSYAQWSMRYLKEWQTPEGQVGQYIKNFSFLPVGLLKGVEPTSLPL